MTVAQTCLVDVTLSKMLSAIYIFHQTVSRLHVGLVMSLTNLPRSIAPTALYLHYKKLSYR